MLKTYKSRFAGQYNGLRFANNLYQTTDEDVQKFIEQSPFFDAGEIKLISEINAEKPTEAVIETLDLSGIPMHALRKKASEMGLKVGRSTKKEELIQIIEQVS